MSGRNRSSPEQQFRKKLMATNLNLVNTELEVLTRGWPDFRRNVLRWQQHRRKTILAVQNIAKELDELHKYANIGRCVGDVMTILGAFGTIAGMVMEHNGSSKSEDVAKFGDTLGKIGCATSMITPVIESGISKMKIREVQKSLKEDDQLLREIAAWLKHSESLDDALKKIFDIGFIPSLEVSRENITMIFKVIEIVYESGKVVYSDIVNGLEDSFVHDFDLRYFINWQLPKMLGSLRGILREPELLEPFNKISYAISRVPAMIETTNSCGNLVSLLRNDGSTNDVAMKIASSLGISQDMSPFYCGLTQSVVIAQKVLSLLSTGQELQNGATTEYSDALRQLKDQLTKELSQISRALPDDFHNSGYRG